MKLKRHERAAQIQEVRLSYNPLVVWLSPRIELIIERGDEIREVAKVVAREWDVPLSTARRMAAYWFALGERAETGEMGEPEWRRDEIQAHPRRRYLDMLSI